MVRVSGCRYNMGTPTPVLLSCRGTCLMLNPEAVSSARHWSSIDEPNHVSVIAITSQLADVMKSRRDSVLFFYGSGIKQT